ncbi:MAG TPA: DUF4266 domain-containing protein [Myxococcota bacterium]|jgi:hypothetical protein|nr:DUF4266 domain-containing protein [Myxococcota bacterium]HTO55752.1 DUF4266 domain-containing protein [Myxococcota bacterium]
MTRALATLLAALALAGCTEVAPWERERLAKPQMAAEPAPELRALREHVYMSREASLGGSFGEGHGCGCY